MEKEIVEIQFKGNPFKNLSEEEAEVFNLCMNLMGGLEKEHLSEEEIQLLKKHGIEL